MMAAPTGPSSGHCNGSGMRGPTYSCSRGSRGTKVSRDTLRVGKRNNSEPKLPSRKSFHPSPWELVLGSHV